MPRKQPENQHHRFPDGFLWGASTAAHQVEGQQDNNWSRWEPTVADHLAETAPDRLRDTVPDWGLIKEDATDPNSYISGQAVDHYNRYEEDFDILAELGLNAYRFSIEWSQVEPEPGKFDREALDHYQDMIDALRNRGIEPMVSLHHFTNPGWLDDMGGWHSGEIVDRFDAFAATVAEKLDNVTYWITVNEPGSYLLMRYLGGGIWPEWPRMESNFRHGYAYLRNVVKAHRAAYERIKHANSDAWVGMAHGLVDFAATRSDPLTFGAKRLSEYIPDGYLLKRTLDHMDFIGVNYYVHMNVRSRLSSPRNWYVEGIPDAPQNDMGWSIYPGGIYAVTQRMKSYDRPMLIMENGVPDKTDAKRTDSIREHLAWIQRSIADGADIRGYFHWSLLDNFEWSEGFWPKFGLVEVDRHTQERYVRPSAREYGRIAINNALEVE